MAFLGTVICDGIRPRGHFRHRPPDDENEEIGDGGRTAAAIGASQFGDVLMVSEGGQLSFYQNGHCIWTL